MALTPVPHDAAAPVFPNAGVEAWYRTELQKLVHAMAQDFQNRITAAWREAGLAQDAKKPSPSLLLERAMGKWGTAWTNRFNEASRKIAWNFAVKNADATDRAVMRTLADAGFVVKFRPSAAQRFVLDAVVAENVALIKSIPTRYHTDVSNVVWENLSRGGDMRTMSEQLVEKYGIAHRRAAFIASDQNNKAKAAMEKFRRLENGITEAYWMHSHGVREPRETHLANNNKPYNVADGWYDPAVDKHIWPGTEPRCHCTDRARIPGFG